MKKVPTMPPDYGPAFADRQKNAQRISPPPLRMIDAPWPPPPIRKTGENCKTCGAPYEPKECSYCKTRQ